MPELFVGNGDVRNTARTETVMIDQWIAFYRETEQNKECLTTMKTALLAYFWEKRYYFDVASSLPVIFEDFTFDRILSCWADKELHVYEEPPVSLSEEERFMVSDAIQNNGLGDAPEASGTFLCALYQRLNQDDACEMIECDVSESMTDILRRHVAASDRFFDPHCGCGALLSGVYDALMNLYYQDFCAETIESIHRKIVSSQLCGCAQTPLAALIASITLALKYKVCCMDAQISVCGDAKKKRRKHERFDWVLSDLYGAYNRLLLLDEDHIISRFFKDAEEYLEKSGNLLFSLDQNFNHDPSALSLREKILRDYTLRGIVEYTDPTRKSALPMIYFLANGKKEEAPVAEIRKQVVMQRTGAFHRNLYGTDAVYVRQNDLHPWDYQFIDLRNHDPLFRIESRCTLRLKDILQFYQGIISGCDKAFVVEGNSLIFGECIDECGVPWIKGKDITDSLHFYGQYLLYTNDIDDIKKYPATKRRLELYKKLLSNRRECIKGIRAWYELQWGREKKLFLREKLVFPSTTDRSRFFCDRKGYFFSADICAALLHDEFDQLIDLEQLALLLNSDIYDTYLKSKIKKLGENRYAYYPNDIKQIMIPPIDVIQSFQTEDDVKAYFEG